MTEPETKTAQPDSPDPSANATGSWDIAVLPESAVPPLVESPTLARTEVSTPGPEGPERRTDTENTEPLREPVVSDRTLPLIEGYTILGKLKGGGMGVVFRALEITPPRIVALKIVKPEWGGNGVFADRFQREVHTLAAIEHPNVVPIYRAGVSNGHTFFTMRLVPGGDLAPHLGRFTGN